MRLRTVSLLAAAGLVAGPLLAHDMFLRPDSHFVPAGTKVLIRLLNGTFTKSENAITRDRLLDVAIVSPAGRVALDTAQWGVMGDTSTFMLTTGASGTYVLGTSTRPKVLAMKGADFNAYLAEDGVPDELAARRRDGRLDEGSRERYHKHVKALVQVGAEPSNHFGTVLGYPSEIVPLANPYALKVGATLPVRVLSGGKPVASQFVQYGGRTTTGGRVPQRSTRTDAEGVARIPLDRVGDYYVKIIHMRRLTADADANYESRWSTLTFAMR
ncbi:MAG: DUF4198 domain-containing protein [Gemmatimonadaceae bacterium]|jgi:uncharacterized GH25 family protein|nr:DUF4198 domain-containing protein [Gemmatimonadaceae bacterium]